MSTLAVVVACALVLLLISAAKVSHVVPEPGSPLKITTFLLIGALAIFAIYILMDPRGAVAQMHAAFRSGLR